MLKYDKKNINSLINTIQELISIREYDIEIKASLLELVYNGWTPNEDVFKEMLQDPMFLGDEQFTMQMATYLYTQGYAQEEIDETIFFNYYFNCIKKMDVNEFKENPFIKNIHFDKGIISNKNNVEFKINYFDKYELQQINTLKRERNCTAKPILGYFNEKVEFPQLCENGETWMSITPSEINTMKTPLKHMKGNVLVFGLGLGYFPYMSALKDTVTSVTIVELNNDIIEIFDKNILPQISPEIASKIKVINADAKEIFLDKEFIKNFDTCFIDIWKNSQDGALLYAYFKEHEKIHKIKPYYWIEDDIILQYQDDLISYICYIFLNGIYDKENKQAYYSTVKSRVFINKIENYFSKNKYIIKDKSDIYNLIFDSNIMRKIMKLPCTSE